MDGYGHWPGGLTPALDKDVPLRPFATPDPEMERKGFSTLHARAALRGYRLERTEADDGGPLFVITRWALTRQLRDMAEERLFLERVGATA